MREVSNTPLRDSNTPCEVNNTLHRICSETPRKDRHGALGRLAPRDSNTPRKVSNTPREVHNTPYKWVEDRADRKRKQAALSLPQTPHDVPSVRVLGAHVVSAESGSLGDKKRPRLMQV